jgi:hypothetical protein
VGGWTWTETWTVFLQHPSTPRWVELDCLPASQSYAAHSHPNMNLLVFIFAWSRNDFQPLCIVNVSEIPVKEFSIICESCRWLPLLFCTLDFCSSCS